MGLLPIEDALSRILDGVAPTEAEAVALDAAADRILAEDVAATRDQPPFNASAMDGYAVRATDLGDGSARLLVIGEASAGAAFDGAVETGQAVRIFTGAPMPSGTDAIVIQENTVRDGDYAIIDAPVPEGKFVRPRGLDFARDEVLLRRGCRLGAREIALAASMNHPTLPVRSRPIVAILPTGDELVLPGSAPRDDQIIASNNFGLAAMVSRAGATPVDLGIARDTRESLSHAIAAAGSADILVTIGGASVGDHDLVHVALKDAGMEPAFWKIAMRPGKPLMFGHIGSQRVLGLPGNPVSSFVCACVFLMPLIAALLDRPDHDPLHNASLGCDVPPNDERQDYLRATLSYAADGRLTATPFLKQDSSMLRMLTRADCLLIRPPNDQARPEGHPVKVLPIDF